MQFCNPGTECKAPSARLASDFSLGVRALHDNAGPHKNPKIFGASRMLSLRNCRIGVIGLGYVGLPLAVEFGKHFNTVGFDIKPQRIAELKSGKDSTLETTPEELKHARRLKFTTSLDDLRECRVFIVTVPTPIDTYKRPDLTPLVKASE